MHVSWGQEILCSMYQSRARSVVLVSEQYRLCVEEGTGYYVLCVDCYELLCKAARLLTPCFTRPQMQPSGCALAQYHKVPVPGWTCQQLDALLLFACPAPGISAAGVPHQTVW
jgi:hypothetical protein